MREYACLMLKYEQPEFIRELQKKIPEDELYFGKNGDEREMYGIEPESHVTVCYGLDNDVKFKDLVQYLKPLKDYKSIIVNISTFENNDFDVLKCDVKCPTAKETNRKIMENFDVHTNYPEYNAHMTIAYFKKGEAKKYAKQVMPKIPTLKPIQFSYSYYDGKQDQYEHHDQDDVEDMKEKEINEAFNHFFDELTNISENAQ